MKLIYFVRHGESESNAGDFHSDENTPITPKGRIQAQAIAERCAKLPLECLITSTFIRTKETAGYIAQKTSLKLEESDLFVENRYVSSFTNKQRDDSESKEAMKIIMKNWGKPGFHFADEENFDDIRLRAKNALAYLTQRPEEHIAVVTHGGFLRNIVGSALFGDGFDAKVSTIFYYGLQVMENTALTILKYDEENLAHPWRLVVWNDQAHL